jgi:hypothetical protein
VLSRALRASEGLTVIRSRVCRTLLSMTRNQDLRVKGVNHLESEKLTHHSLTNNLATQPCQSRRLDVSLVKKRWRERDVGWRWDAGGSGLLDGRG